MPIITYLDDIVFLIFIITFSFMVIANIIDKRKKRVPKSNPFISFIVPTYNDGESLPGTIKSIFTSYKKEKFEVVVINDKSKDSTPDILKKISKEYSIKIINNSENMGKARSVNKAFESTKGEIIWIVDSDSELRKEVVDEIIARLDDPKVGAASCRYMPKNKGFLPSMQAIEYGMLGLIQTAHNHTSTVAVWGGCMAVKRDAFIKVGMLNPHALTEDQDLALKIGEIGLKAQEGALSVYTYVPESVKALYKQKLRWAGGGMQNFLVHHKYFIKNPIAIIFLFTNALLAMSFAYSFVNNIIFIKNFIILFDSFRELGNSLKTSIGLAGAGNSLSIIKTISIYLLFPLFSIPYVANNYSLKKEPLRILLIFPFSLIYFPIYSIVSAIGFGKGAYLHFRYGQDKRAW